MPTREIKTIFAIDGNRKYTEAIKEINKEHALLNAKYKAAGAAAEAAGDKQGKLRIEAEKLRKEIELQKNKVNEIKNAVEQSTAKYTENAESTQELKIQYYNAEAALSKLQGQLIATNKDLATQESKLIAVGDAAEKAGKKITKVGDGMSKAGTALSVGLTAPIAAAAGYSVKAAMDFESAFAGVKKTIDATPEQLAEIEQGIRDMSKVVPTAATDIAKVAEAAGQLGIKTENIMGFSKAMIDLGESTNLTSDEAATALAQFANITQMDQSKFENLGSAIVALGNNGASTEADITEMSLRLAGAGEQVGLSEPDILGLAASLANVGIEAEAGGTAFSKVMVQMQLAATTGTTANEVISKTGMSLRDLQMFADSDSAGFKDMANSMGYTSEEFRKFMDASSSLESFSKATGISAEDFKKAYEEDAVGAIQLFIENLATAGDRGEDAITILEGMGITEVRMRDALLRSASAGDDMAASIALSNTAWTENNALTKEANQRYETNASKMKMAQNRINDAAITIGDKMLPVVADIAEDVANAAEAFGNLSPEMQETALKALAVVAALGPVLKITGGLTSTVGKATTAVGGLLTKLGNKGVVEGLTQSTTKLGTSAAGASSSVGMLGVAMLATAAASAAIIYGFEKAGEKYDKMSAYVEDFENGVASAHAEIESGTSILSNYSSALTTGSEAMSGYDAGISAAQSRIIELAQLAASETREYTDAEKEEIQKLIDLITDYTGKKVDAYAQQQGIVSSMVSNETVMDKDAAAKYVASAKDAAQQVIDASTKARTDAYAEAVQMYGAGGEKDKAAYQQLIDNADYAYSEQVRIANQSAHDTILAIAAKYYEQNVKDTEYMIAYEDICKRLEEAEKSKNDYITDLWEELGVAEENRNEDNQYYLGVMNAADNKYKNELEAIYEDEANLRGKDGEDAVEYMMALRDDYTVYGQEAIDAAQRVAAGVAAPFGDLASTFYGFGANTINGLISGMQANTPGAYTAAEEAAKGIASAYAKKQKINSPSKVMIGLGVNTMAGLPIGMRSKEQEIRDAAADIANAIPEEMEKAPSPEAMIKMQYDQSGLDTVMRSAGAASIKLSAVGNAASASGLSSVKQVVHSGELTVKGVNNQGEVVGVSKIIMDRLKLDNMMAGR